jgi:hypothetical protein
VDLAGLNRPVDIAERYGAAESLAYALEMEQRRRLS